jgi:hypothetical protein
MESERAFPPPSFPVSLNTFYHTNPHNFKEKNLKLCQHQEKRDFISRQVMLKKRFPSLDLDLHLESLSPIRGTCNYMKNTEQMYHKSRKKSPCDRKYVFKLSNFTQAKEKISRKRSSFDGNPYNDEHDISFKQYLEEKKKRINGTFKLAFKGDFLNDNKVFINSLNTFETFKSKDSSQGEMKSTKLFGN